MARMVVRAEHRDGPVESGDMLPDHRARADPAYVAWDPGSCSSQRQPWFPLTHKHHHHPHPNLPSLKTLEYTVCGYSRSTGFLQITPLAPKQQKHGYSVGSNSRPASTSNQEYPSDLIFTPVSRTLDSRGLLSHPCAILLSKRPPKTPPKPCLLHKNYYALKLKQTHRRKTRKKSTTPDHSISMTEFLLSVW